MNLKSHNILSSLSSNSRHDNMELRERILVVDRERLRFRVKVLFQIEPSNQSAIEVSGNSSGVFHTHIQHMVVIDIGNIHFLTNIGSNSNVGSNFTRLLRYPSRIIEIETIPVLHIVIADLPVASVLNLEREVGREHRTHRSNSTGNLTHFDNHCTHINSQIISSRINPAIGRRVKQLKSVNSVIQTEISIVQRSR